MTPEVAERYRSAIETALSEYLSGEQLDDCMSIWQDKFSSRSRINVQELVSAFSQSVDFGALRSELVVNLVKAFNSSGAVSVKKSNVSASPATTEETETLQAFEQLITAFLDAAPESKRDCIQDAVTRSVESGNLPADLKLALEAWLRNRGKLQMRQVQPTGLRKLVTQFYTAITEEIGPVEADRMLGNAVANVRNSAPALHVHVTQLL